MPSTVFCNASINAFNATPCFADNGLFDTLVVKLSIISVTLTLFVVMPSINVLFDLMCATNSDNWSKSTSSLSKIPLILVVKSEICKRMSLCAELLVLCSFTLPAAVPLGSAPTSAALLGISDRLAYSSCSCSGRHSVFSFFLKNGPMLKGIPFSLKLYAVT